jgi:class 3 adenylate cyclase
MRSPSCEQDNPANARFCVACGTRLGPTCPACGAEAPEGARFCPSCSRPLQAASGAAPESYTPRHLADKILTSRSALRGEREPVTVLFCDMVSSTELASRLGPDGMHALLSRFRRMERVAAEFAVFMADAWRIRGQALMRLGRVEEAEHQLRRAKAEALGLGAAPPAWRAGLALARVLGHAGRRHAASDAAEVARAIEVVSATLGDGALRQRLEDSPEMREARRRRDEA